ncbi:MAG: putative pyridoxamine 5-phosphate oxidase-related protein [Pseudonocardiales bacterium]|nr:putative pyridoxamine 5-phosphate oxidase-related protein [Pseudonocardiales bacterium]
MLTVELTAHDQALLDRPLHGLLTIPAAAGRLPAPRPVWFELTADGQLQLFSATSAQKVRRLEAEPKASLLAVRPTGEPEGWLSIEADVTLHHDGAADLASRLADRYWDMTEAAHRSAVEAWAVEDLTRIVLHPRRVTRGPA